MWSFELELVFSNDWKMMPEGHVLHRAARLQGKRFNGKVVEMSSPQGRFREGADRLNGQMLETIEAKGKHLFYRFDSGDELHVHLGLFGKFRVQKRPEPGSDALSVSPNCRVLMTTNTDQLHLAGPNQCEVLEPWEADAVRDRLGPDPIQNRPEGADQFYDLLQRRSIPIGKSIMVQEVISGIGNIYRSELLFQIGLDPWCRSKDVHRETVDLLWEQSVRELKDGERLGKIITTEPIDFGREKRRDLKRDERLYVYKRNGRPCRRCGDEVVAADIDGRNVWWCPSCQPG